MNINLNILLLWLFHLYNLLLYGKIYEINEANKQKTIKLNLITKNAVEFHALSNPNNKRDSLSAVRSQHDKLL